MSSQISCLTALSLKQLISVSVPQKLNVDLGSHSILSDSLIKSYCCVVSFVLRYRLSHALSKVINNNQHMYDILNGVKGGTRDRNVVLRKKEGLTFFHLATINMNLIQKL